MKKLIIVSLTGFILGAMVSKYLFVGSGLNLLLWGAVALVIGWGSDSKMQSFKNGAVYGFILSFFFMYVGYAGSAPIISRIPFFAILGIVGAVCAMILAIISFQIRKFFKK